MNAVAAEDTTQDGGENTAETHAVAQSRATRIVARVAGWFAGFAGALTVVMGLHIVADVCARNFFNVALPGTIDFIQFWWMPLVALMPLAFAELGAGQIAVTLLGDLVKGLSQKVTTIIERAVNLVAALLMAYAMTHSAMSSYEKQESAVGYTWIPVWPIQILIAISFYLLAIASVVKLWDAIAHRVPEEEHVYEGGAL